MSHDPEGLRRFFDAYGETEWHRLEATLPGRIKFAVHRDVLDRYLSPGLEVLDVGCGPGRFARHMAGAGAFVTLVDISDIQLALARERLAEAGLEGRVRGAHRLDVVALDAFDDASFDLVVCYGAVLSYVRERHVEALAELVRVTRPGGTILVSVTGLYGTLRLIGPLDEAAFARDPDAHLDWQAVLDGSDVVLTRPGSPDFHQPMALFTARGLSGALTAAGLEVLEIATSNPLVSTGASIPRLAADPTAAASLEQIELALSRRPGLADAGEHLIAACRRP